MKTLEEKITALEDEIDGYADDLKKATTPEEKSELRGLITSRTETLGQPAGGFDYFRVTGKIEDSRTTSKGYRSTVYKCAQDSMAFYCEDGNKKSIFYEEAARDLSINLLFEHKQEAFAFQNSLVNFRFIHPSFGSKIIIDKTVNPVHLMVASTRVFHMDFDGADNNESPVLSLADIRHVLSSQGESVSYDPIKALQSLEDITVFPGTKYYWCHLLTRQSKKDKNDENNCIWGSWVFHQYFDALNTEKIGIPLIAVKYISTSQQTEDMPVGDKHETRKRVSVEIQFFDSDTGRRAAFAFQSMMKFGTNVTDALRYDSYLHPRDPVKMKKYLDIKYAETMKAWREETK